MPRIIKRQRISTRIYIALAITFGIVLLALCTWLFTIYQHYRASQEFSQLKSKTAALVANNEFEQAANLWAKSAQDSSNEPSHRVEAWQSAGDDYMSAKDYENGLACYQNAEKISGSITYAEAARIAEAAVLLHKRTLAIQYLQKEIALIPKDMFMPEAQRQMLEQEINQLQKAQ